MSGSPDRNYQSISDMDQEAVTVSWKRFFVHVAGKTNGAHRGFVAKLEKVGHSEVNSPEDSDYLLVFCPVASRVGTDVGEALESIPGGKPTVLVVMHHTFNPDTVVAQSRRLVDNPNVLLTVDCLFHKGELLKCNRNDIAWFEVQKFFGVPAFQVSIWNGICKWLRINWWLVAFVGSCLLVVAVRIDRIVDYVRKKI